MIRICLKEYLERLRAIEAKKGDNKRHVPSMNELARLSGLHRGSLNRIANNHSSAIRFSTGNAIISTMNDIGFDMKLSDLMVYDKSLSAKKTENV